MKFPKQVFDILREVNFHGYNLDKDDSQGLKFCVQFNEIPSKSQAILEKLRDLAKEYGYKFSSEQISRNIFRVSFTLENDKILEAKRLLESSGYVVY